jgi:hypothetical protein
MRNARTYIAGTTARVWPLGLTDGSCMPVMTRDANLQLEFGLIRTARV